MTDKLTARLERMLARAVEVRAESVGKTQDVAAGFVDGLHAALSTIRELAAVELNGERWVVLVGNPLKGIACHGPFLEWTDANAWGDRHAPNAEFWVAPLVLHPAEPGPRLAVSNKDET